MNILLSVYVDRPKNECKYAVYEDGSMKESFSRRCSGTNIKENNLSAIVSGLRVCRKYVSHDKILYIEVQNRHLCEWLNGRVDFKDYSKGLDEVYEVLESMDCRYRFVFKESPKVKKEIIKSEVKGSGFDNIMSEFV